MPEEIDKGEEFVSAPAASDEAPAVGKPAPPIPAPQPEPMDGWLAKPQMALCWIRAEAGKSVEVKLATEYDVTSLDTGTGDPVEVMRDTGKKIAR